MEISLPDLGDANVEAAYLRVWQVAPEDAKTVNVTPRRAEDSWKVGEITWNSQPPNYTTGDKGGQLPPQAGWQDIDITLLVRSWYSGSPNNGFLLEAVDEGDAVLREFVWDADDYTHRPMVYLYVAPDQGENPCADQRETIEFFPRRAPYGTEFYGVGYSFNPNSRVYYSINKVINNRTVRSGPKITDDRGTFDLSFDVDQYASPNGETDFTLTIEPAYSDCSYVLPFTTTPKPSLVVNPEYGRRPYWDEVYDVELTAENLAPNEMALVSMIKPNGDRFEFGEVYVDGEGRFRNGPFNLMRQQGRHAVEFAQGGFYTLQALDGADQLTSTVFQVIRPRLSLWGEGDDVRYGASGWVIGPGRELFIQGRNYEPNTQVPVMVRNLDTQSTRLLTVARTDDVGSFTLSTEIYYESGDPIRDFDHGRNRIYTNDDNVEEQARFIFDISAPFDWPDVQVSMIEITQGLQNHLNSAPLVARKKTWVRVYVRSYPIDVPNVTCILRATRDGEPLEVNCYGEMADSIYAIQPWHPDPAQRAHAHRMTVKPTGSQRNDLSSTFVFPAPWNWIEEEGELSIMATLIPPIPRRLPENDSLTRTVTLERSGVLPVVRIRVNQDLGSPPNHHDDYPLITRYVEHMYPLAINQFREYYTKEWVGNWGGRFDLTERDEWSDLLFRLGWYDFWTPDPMDDTHYYGMVNNAYRGQTEGGIAGLGERPGYRACGFWDWTVDPNNERWRYPDGGRILAHELGHNFGRRHVDSSVCGQNPENQDGNYPYQDGLIAGGANRGFWGFSPYSFNWDDMEVIDPTTTYDIMSYCFPQWISYYQLVRLFRSLTGNYDWPNMVLEGVRTQKALDRYNRAQEYLILGGIVDTEGDGSRFHPGYRMIGLPEDHVQKYSKLILEDGGAELLQLDGSGNKLRGDLIPLDVCMLHGKNSLVPFFMTVPMEFNTKNLEIRYKEETKATLKVSDNAPTVSVASPKENMVVPTTLTFFLNLNDADGDTLYTHFQFRPDENSPWDLVPHVEKAGDSFAIPNDFLPAAENGMFRIVVTDGLNTTYHEPAYKFSVRNKATGLSIQQPLPDSNFNQNNPILLAGQATDPEDGWLEGESLRWDVDGYPLGTGTEWLWENAGAGTHTITLTARDSEGLETATSLTLYVTPFEPLLAVDPPAPEYLSPAYGGWDVPVEAPLSWQVSQAGTVLIDGIFPPFEGAPGGMDVIGDHLLVAQAYNPARVFVFDPEMYWTVRSFDAPYQLNGICYDGAHYWGTKLAPLPKIIFRFDEAGNVLAEYPMAENYSPVGITWDGGYIWVLGYGDPGYDSAIFKVDPYSGEFLQSFDLGMDRVSGLCFDGKAFWLNDRDNALTCRVSREDGGLLGSFNTPPSAGMNNGAAVAYKGGAVWVYNQDSNYLYPTSPGELTLEGDVFYDVYLDQNYPPQTLAGANMTTPSMVTKQLDGMQFYFWRVIAWTPEGGESLGPVWSFTTGMPPLGVDRENWYRHE